MITILRNQLLLLILEAFKVIDFDKGLFELNTGDKHTQVITYRKDSLFSRGSFSRQIGIPTKSQTLLMPT